MSYLHFGRLANNWRHNKVGFDGRRDGRARSAREQAAAAAARLRRRRQPQPEGHNESQGYQVCPGCRKGVLPGPSFVPPHG